MPPKSGSYSRPQLRGIERGRTYDVAELILECGDVPDCGRLDERRFCRGSNIAGRPRRADCKSPLSRSVARVRLAKLEFGVARQVGEALGRIDRRDHRRGRIDGIAACRRGSAEQKSRGYITLIRRNWHLLPYDQLLELLEMTPEQLAFSLREDDFLWIKLGIIEAQVRAPALRRPGRGGPRGCGPRSSGSSKRSSATTLRQPGEPRFGFLQRFSSAPRSAVPQSSGPPCPRPASRADCRCASSIPIPRSTATRFRARSWIPIPTGCCSGFRPWESTASGCTSCFATWRRAGPPSPSSAPATSGAWPIFALWSAGRSNTASASIST